MKTASLSPSDLYFFEGGIPVGDTFVLSDPSITSSAGVKLGDGELDFTGQDLRLSGTVFPDETAASLDGRYSPSFCNSSRSEDLRVHSKGSFVLLFRCRSAVCGACLTRVSLHLIALLNKAEL